MFKASYNSAVVSATDLKREYKKVQQFLKGNNMVIVTNRNNDSQPDGIIVPYSKAALEVIENLLEDFEMMMNKEELEKEIKESLSSGGGKRYSLKEVMDEEGIEI